MDCGLDDAADGELLALPVELPVLGVAAPSELVLFVVLVVADPLPAEYTPLVP
jgi:hypothetical protein